MNIEHFLVSRYKVIADYPNSFWNVGYIFICDGHIIPDFDLDRYPHLFKKLAWWEDRAVEDMPEYVKLRNGDIVEPKTWNLKQGIVYFKHATLGFMCNDFAVLDNSEPIIKPT